MSTTPAPPDALPPVPDWHTAFDVFHHVLGRLPESCEERWNLAVLAAYRASYGDNVALIGREMRRTRKWVYKRFEMLRELFKPDADVEEN